MGAGYSDRAFSLHVFKKNKNPTTVNPFGVWWEKNGSRRRISREAVHSDPEREECGGEPHPKWARLTIVRQGVFSSHFAGILFVGGFRTIWLSFY
mmetsp:Transcript_28793/g.29154  ORF Transcript_28793/g.29154 Transcript_28793/m.29154 type:complete len:95 (-) Transcript_28793:21-305(-)